MSRQVLSAPAALALAWLAACSQAEDADSEATMPMEQGSMPGRGMMMDDQEMDRQMAAMSGPFADSERNMHRAMRSAIGVDVADTWTRKMIAHHQGAIDMAEAFLEQDGGSERARALAQRTIDKQSKEIEELQRLVKDGDPQRASAQAFMPAERDMMRAMMRVPRGDVTDTFLTKMLEHHKGGVTLSDAVLPQGGDETILAKARKTRDDQAKEADETEKLLSG